MSITVRIPPALRSLTGGQDQISVTGATLREAIDGLESAHPGIKDRICDDKGQVLRFVNLFIGDEDIRMLDGLDTALKDGDAVSIIPAIAGGRS